MPRGITAFSVFACLCLGAPRLLAQPGPDGIDWVTVGAPGNRAYDGPDPFNLVAGRGAVDYEFKIGRYEVTTAQWMEFFNAAFARPDPLPFSGLWFDSPSSWGARRDPNYQGPGERFILRNVPGAGMLPVGGISWRTAAVFCNWMENGKSSDRSAFLNGAYDTSTFTPDIAHPTFNDQAAHNPGARYWIPTLDEWMKAVHYDPNANNGQGRWWEQPNGTDIPLVYGPPPSFGGDGSGMANSGFTLPNFGERLIPLGSYPDVQTPWGLLDAAGATSEWLENIHFGDVEMDRGIDGSPWGTTLTGADYVYSWGQVRPDVFFTFAGLRIASSIPAPASALVLITACCVRARRRRSCHAKAQDGSGGSRSLDRPV